MENSDIRLNPYKNVYLRKPIDIQNLMFVMMFILLIIIVYCIIKTITDPKSVQI